METAAVSFICFLQRWQNKMYEPLLVKRVAMLLWRYVAPGCVSSVYWAVRRWQASRKEVHQSLHHKPHSTATWLFQGCRIICIIWATFTLKCWFYFRFMPTINCRFHALRANWKSSYLFMIMKWLTIGISTLSNHVFPHSQAGWENGWNAFPHVS